jgi:transcriptional regulator with XRE-family HTH domain
LDIKRMVGTNIRAARKARGLTQFQLAERSGLSADFIGKMERGTTSPSIESLEAIATALKLPLGDLFAGEAESGPSQEALLELIGLCQGRDKEDIQLLVGIAQLIFQGRPDRSRRPQRGKQDQRCSGGIRAMPGRPLLDNLNHAEYED